MKRLALLLFSGLLISCTSSIAATEVPQNRGREFVEFKPGIMILPFNHWKHQAFAHNDCFSCHKTKIGKVDDWGKKVAHKTCIPCHELENKGPAKCGECHNQ